MLAVISPLIARGVIDNTLRDLTDIRLWCTDGLEPLHFRMKGNCLQDIAGCLVEFTNKAAAPAPGSTPELLQELRTGKYNMELGDVTLSRRRAENNNRRGLSNVLSIELFASTSIRILIETASFTHELTLPQWEMRWEDDNVQQMLNMEVFRRHIETNVQHYQGPSLAQLGDMPICEWDRILNRAEACMAIMPTVQEKYSGLPNAQHSEAYVLGREQLLYGEPDSNSRKILRSETGGYDWEVLDFIDPPHDETVHNAMQHELFRYTSRVTASVQKTIRGMGEQAHSQAIARMLNGYAGIVSHILSTLLLILQTKGAEETASKRLSIICGRLKNLTELCRDMPQQERTTVVAAFMRLHKRLVAFLGSSHSS